MSKNGDNVITIGVVSVQREREEKLIDEGGIAEKQTYDGQRFAMDHDVNEEIRVRNEITTDRVEMYVSIACK